MQAIQKRILRIHQLLWWCFTSLHLVEVLVVGLSAWRLLDLNPIQVYWCIWVQFVSCQLFRLRRRSANLLPICGRGSGLMEKINFVSFFASFQRYLDICLPEYVLSSMVCFLNALGVKNVIDNYHWRRYSVVFTRCHLWIWFVFCFGNSGCIWDLLPGFDIQKLILAFSFGGKYHSVCILLAWHARDFVEEFHVVRWCVRAIVLFMSMWHNYDRLFRVYSIAFVLFLLPEPDGNSKSSVWGKTRSS